MSRDTRVASQLSEVSFESKGHFSGKLKVQTRDQKGILWGPMAAVGQFTKKVVDIEAFMAQAAALEAAEREAEAKQKVEKKERKIGRAHV